MLQSRYYWQAPSGRQYTTLIGMLVVDSMRAAPDRISRLDLVKFKQLVARIREFVDEALPKSGAQSGRDIGLRSAATNWKNGTALELHSVSRLRRLMPRSPGDRGPTLGDAG